MFTLRLNQIVFTCLRNFSYIIYLQFARDYCVRYVSTKLILAYSSVCDHGVPMLGNGTERKTVVRYTVQTTICNPCSCVKKCEQCVKQSVYVSKGEHFRIAQVNVWRSPSGHELSAE